MVYPWVLEEDLIRKFIKMLFFRIYVVLLILTHPQKEAICTHVCVPMYACVYI